MLKNNFSLTYFAEFVNYAKAKGYIFKTVRQFYDEGCPSEKVFILRHDLDCKPKYLKAMLEKEMELGVPSTIYVRVTANDYNPFDYCTFPLLKQAEDSGFEIGLHTNFLEFSHFQKLDAEKTLASELACLRSFFKIDSLSTHRDINYTLNALPWVEERWEHLKSKYGLVYQGYDKKLFDNSLYVNEGLNPHLCWRNWTPEKAIETGKSIYMLLHPHWWYKDHPFEF